MRFNWIQTTTYLPWGTVQLLRYCEGLGLVNPPLVVSVALSPKSTKMSDKKRVSKMSDKKRVSKTSSKTCQPDTSPTSMNRNKECFFCPICDEVILDAVGNKPGEDSIQCDGSCATWLHRRCAGLSKEAFSIICKSSNPFFCPQCRLDNQELELKSLRDMVTSLSSHLSLIADELVTIKAHAKVSVPSESDTGRSYASAVSTDKMSAYPTSCENSKEPFPANRNIVTKAATAQDERDRKFNLIIFGLRESKIGTPKHRRNSNDHTDVCDILSSVDPNVTSNSIRDCFRLGKFNPDRNRPVLVKMIRSHEVASVLSNRKKLATTPGISIKPDLSPEDRKVESLLLKERRSLIHSGVDRKEIKIKGNTLLVNKEKHGHVINSTFERISRLSNPSQYASQSSLKLNSKITALPDEGKNEIHSQGPSRSDEHSTLPEHVPCKDPDLFTPPLGTTNLGDNCLSGTSPKQMSHTDQ